jgi:hypothetical protein
MFIARNISSYQAVGLQDNRLGIVESFLSGWLAGLQKFHLGNTRVLKRGRPLCVMGLVGI